MSDVITTTTGAIDGKPVVEHRGIAIAEATLGTNAVVGVDIDYENVATGSSGSMLMVSVSGTAVVAR